MKPMEQELKDMFGQTPDSFNLALERALAGEVPAQKKSTARRPGKTWVVVLIAALALALTTGGYAAALRLGLLDMLSRNELGPVPLSAQELLAQTKAQTYEVGPLTVSFNEALVDGYVACIVFQSKMTDDSEALLINWTDSFYLSIPNCYRSYADVDSLPRACVGELALAWDGPIYSVSTWLEFDHKHMKGEEMIMDSEWGSDGSILTGRLFEIKPDELGDTLPAVISIRVQEIEMAGPPNPETFAYPIKTGQEWTLEAPVELPVYGTIETREYQVEGSNDLGIATVEGMELERTGAEFYAHIRVRATDAEMVYHEFPWLELMDGEGEYLPEGMLGTFYIEHEHWPEATVTLSIAIDEFPETVQIPYRDKLVRLK